VASFWESLITGPGAALGEPERVEVLEVAERAEEELEEAPRAEQERGVAPGAVVPVEAPRAEALQADWARVREPHDSAQAEAARLIDNAAFAAVLGTLDGSQACSEAARARDSAEMGEA
jgi:hypothetical protein